jgi:hypothetical protein
MGTIDSISAPIQPADRFMSRALWWLSLVVAPAVLIALELFHPANFTKDPGMYAYLSQPEQHSSDHYALGYFGPDWWFVLHMIQTPMVCLVAIGLWRLLAPVGAADGPLAMAAAWLARVSVFAFLVFYTILDAIGGIGLGRSIVVLKGWIADGTLKKEQADGAIALLNRMWVDDKVGGVGSLISHGGSYAVLAATVLIVVALFPARRIHWLPAILLVAFGYQLQESHAAPHGPIAFALLIAAALVMAWQGRKQPV